MSRLKLFLIILISAFLVGGSIALWAAVSNNDDDGEQEIPLSEVPQVVIDAANEAVPDGEIEEVEKEIEGSQITYEVEKVVNGVEYDIEVTPDGVVKEVEIDDEEDDD